MKQRPINPRHETLAIVVSLVLLCGAAAESTRFRASPDSSEYLDRVRAAAAAIPTRIGLWEGKDTPVEESAVRLLHPNVLFSRQYQNIRTRLFANLLFVDCQDARDLEGHYPPVCYPSQGWSLQTSDPIDWQLPDMTVHGMEYMFVRGAFDSNSSMYVDDFMVLPGQGTARDMDAINAAARNLDRRFYGAAHMQVCFSTDVPADQRRHAFDELVGGAEPFLRTVLSIQRPPSAPSSHAGEASAPGDSQ
jgi:Protein of unknown function (DUF3485)